MPLTFTVRLDLLRLLLVRSPDGSPSSATLTRSPSASVTVMPNFSIVSPWAYVLFPGGVITGGACVFAVTAYSVFALALPPASRNRPAGTISFIRPSRTGRSPKV